MTIEFRCEKCGKLLTVDDPSGKSVRCEHCHKKVTVPAALASLPRPHVPPETRTVPVETDEPVDPSAETAVMAALAGAMPWVLSAFLHLGLFLVMVFVVMLVTEPEPTQPPKVFSSLPYLSEASGGVMEPKTWKPLRGSKDRATVRIRRKRKRPDEIDPGRSKKVIRLLAPGPEGNSGAEIDIGLKDSRAIDGPPVRFITPDPGGAYNIVYVVDRSGSMSPYFHEVRTEMIRSISRLEEVQQFHIVLFNNNRTTEGPRRRLVAADTEHRLAAVRFLQDVRAEGQTTALVALQRAFAVLRRADPHKRGKIIFLLTDGDFSGMTGGSNYTTPDGRKLSGNEAVLAWLREHNRPRRVRINTLLFRMNDPRARAVLKTIAEENGGRFKFVSPDE